jgi:hypothetical protein
MKSGASLSHCFGHAIMHRIIITLITGPARGCQMVYFQTKNPNFGKFLRALEWKMLIYFMTIWNILWPYGIIYGRLV